MTNVKTCDYHLSIFKSRSKFKVKYFGIFEKVLTQGISSHVEYQVS